MEEQLISFKTAKLAKEKGIIIYSKNHYLEDGEIIENENFPDDCFIDNIYAPTQSLLQRWIREKYNNHIAIMPHLIPSNEVKYYIFKHRLGVKSFEELFDSYEDALESALYESLLLI